MNKNNKKINNSITLNLLFLDTVAENGIFTDKKGKNNLDMRAIREFCKRENREYSSLTDEEISRFKK